MALVIQALNDGCAQPLGTVTNGQDCDDGNLGITALRRLCNGIDDNCDGVTDEQMATHPFGTMTVMETVMAERWPSPVHRPRGYFPRRRL